MPTNDGFDSDYRLPRFLADEPEQQGIAKASDRTPVSSRVLKASIWVAAATALGIAVLSVVNPMMLFAEVTASFADVKALLADKPTPQAVADQSTPTIQSASDVQPAPPAEKEEPAREQVAAVSEPAVQREADSNEPVTEELFRQFQAWAAERDARTQPNPAPSAQDGPAPIVQNAPAQVAEDARASLRPAQKRRHARPIHSARAELPPVHTPRKKVRRAQSPRVQEPPAQEARAPEPGQGGQDAQPPSFLQSLGFRN
jgi:hypothetical protein